MSGPFHPGEWQSRVHEPDYAQIKDNPRLWGSFVWVMFDFASAGRREGSQIALNDKGLVSQDRRLRKNAYFFYQANWSATPVVHLCSRRATPRTKAVTDITVYSNCPAVELWVNGRSAGAAGPDNGNVFRWHDIALQPGPNAIKVLGHSEKDEPEDQCIWVLKNAAVP